MLNPTNAPALLTKNTALATLCPIADDSVFSYDKKQTETKSPSVDHDCQLKTLTDLGLTIDASDYTKAQKEKLISLLYNNRDLFTSNIFQLPGTDFVKHHIDTGNATPIRQRSYRHRPEARKELDRQVDRLLEADIIEESDSPWGRPVVLVKKRNNTHRLCVDMRKVNSVTKPIFFPLFLLEDVFQTVAENNPTTFSVFDLTSGFWQIKLDDSSKPKTAFVTHRGNYQFKRMPFGIQGAPTSYQALMSKVLRNILFSYALCYVDDVLCMSTSPDLHCEHLAEIFARFRQAKLRLNPSKCKIALTQVVYLGHVLSKDGVSVDDSKVKLIRSHPIPKNAQQLRSFLGIANYYRRFIKHFSIKTVNLRGLLKRDAKFVWNSVHQEEFDFLKNALTSAPILAFPNMQKEMILTTDACTSGIAYILSQLDDQGREHVIAYLGRGLRKAELNYTITELECLAIIEGTRAYHQYLVSRPFTIVTDHVSLTFLNSLKTGKSRLQRWALHLQGYTFKVQYKAGKRLTSADGLSRRDYPTPPAETDNDALDDDAFISCIEPDLFECTTNPKHITYEHIA